MPRMAAVYQRHSTDDLPAGDRCAAWSDWMASLFNGLASDLLGQSTFDGHVVATHAGQVQLTHLRASGHRVIQRAPATRQHSAPRLKIVVPRAGRVAIAQQGRCVWVPPGGWGIYDTSQPYEVHNPEACEHLIITVPKADCEDRLTPLAPLMGRHVGGARGITRLARDTMCQTFTERTEMSESIAHGAGELIIDLVRLSLRELSGQSADAQPHWVLRERILDHINRHLADTALSIAHIASALNCSKRQLHKAFADADESLARTIQRRRLEACMRDLRSPLHAQRTVTDIALAWGFNNMAHFSKVFHAHAGMPPSVYRATRS